MSDESTRKKSRRNFENLTKRDDYANLSNFLTDEKKILTRCSMSDKN